MMATNHVLTGSIFAAATVTYLPVEVILPAAFLLHFVLDSLPHYGQKDKPVAALDRLRWLLPLDAALAAAVLLSIVVVQPSHWPVLVASGILCASPDLWSARRYLRFLRTRDPSITKDWFAQFHHWIQWGERLWGAWIELAWLLSFGFMLIARF
ncbi:MAG TPA: hypothetical protein VF261_00895 [Candidatus Saccharimonadales bacterium]